MNQPPKVSVCIPVHNGLPWIQSTIESVFAQTSGDFEVIVRDDCSTDGTVEFLLERFGGDGRLRVVRNHRKLDVGGQYNHLFRDALGDFVLKLDADDLLAPDFLERAYQAAKISDADVVMTGFEWLRTDDGETRRPGVQLTVRDGHVEQPFQMVIEKNPFSLCFGIWRRSLLSSIERDDQFVLFTETCDCELQLRLALRGARFYYISDVLGWYRVHSANRSLRLNAQAESALCDVFPYWHEEIREIMGRRWLKKTALRHLREHLASVARGRTFPSRKIIMGVARLIAGRVEHPHWCVRPDLLTRP